MSKNRTTSAQFHEEVSLFIKGYGEKLKIEGKECFHIPYYFREIEENIFEVVEVESPIKNNRIVSDITFAKKLLEYQKITITDENEKEYFENLK